jgi:hypothetical protein
MTATATTHNTTAKTPASAETRSNRSDTSASPFPLVDTEARRAALAAKAGRPETEWGLASEFAAARPVAGVSHAQG